jgi:hypothetical protein
MKITMKDDETMLINTKIDNGSCDICGLQIGDGPCVRIGINMDNIKQASDGTKRVHSALMTLFGKSELTSCLPCYALNMGFKAKGGL